MDSQSLTLQQLAHIRVTYKPAPDTVMDRELLDLCRLVSDRDALRRECADLERAVAKQKQTQTAAINANNFAQLEQVTPALEANAQRLAQATAALEAIRSQIDQAWHEFDRYVLSDPTGTAAGQSQHLLTQTLIR